MEEALNAKEAPLHQQKKARTSKKTQQQQAQKRVQQALLDKGGVQMKASRCAPKQFWATLHADQLAVQ
jgi:hypothetical protein